MKCVLYAGLLTTVICIACDPARRISMINRSSDTASFIWTARDDSIGFNPFVLNNSTRLSFQIPPGKNKAINLTFGIGQWTQDYIDGLMKYLSAVQIKTNHQTINLDSTDTIKDYFLAHRKKRYTVIEVDVQ